MEFIDPKCFRITILHHKHTKCVSLVISQKLGTRVANIYRPEDVTLRRSCVRMTIEKTTAIKPTIFWRRSEPTEMDRFFIAPTTGALYRQFRYTCARRSDITSSFATVVCPVVFDTSMFGLVDIIPIIYRRSTTKKKKKQENKKIILFGGMSYRRGRKKEWGEGIDLIRLVRKKRIENGNICGVNIYRLSIYFIVTKTEHEKSFLLYELKIIIPGR